MPDRQRTIGVRQISQILRYKEVPPDSPHRLQDPFVRDVTSSELLLHHGQALLRSLVFQRVVDVCGNRSCRFSEIAIWGPIRLLGQLGIL